MQIKSYEQLIVWQKSIELVAEIYRATRSFPKNEMYALTSQLRRASVSIASNIAEGQGRCTTGEFLQSLGFARGSLYEVRTQLKIAELLGYLRAADVTGLEKRLDEVGRLLNGLMSSLRRNQPLATRH